MRVKNRRRFTAIQWKEIKRKMSKGEAKINDVKGYKRLLALHMRGLGKSNDEISEVLGFSSSYITELVSKYIKNGMEAILYSSHINCSQIQFLYVILETNTLNNDCTAIQRLSIT